MPDSRHEPEQLVRCLSCGFAYQRPAARGGWYDNPGCPRCGYAGWARFWSDLPLSRSTDV